MSRDVESVDGVMGMEVCDWICVSRRETVGRVFGPCGEVDSDWGRDMVINEE